jgi:hypothetical protein
MLFAKIFSTSAAADHTAFCYNVHTLLGLALSRVLCSVVASGRHGTGRSRVDRVLGRTQMERHH